jgi:signal peptidase I
VRGRALGVVGALVVGIALARRRYLQVTVDGPSMLPALAPGERVLARRVPASAVRAGDIVLVERPAGDEWSAPGPGHWVVKRAVAVPGDPVPPDSVAGRGGGLVPAGMYVLLGDNAADSTDSRLLGYCPGARIAGVLSGPAALRVRRTGAVSTAVTASTGRRSTR